MNTRSFSEEVSLIRAAAALELFLHGFAHKNDTGTSDSLPDLKIVTPDDVVVLAEVTQEAHRPDIEAMRAIDREHTVTLTPGLGHWYVYVTGKSRINDFRSTVPALLAGLPPTLKQTIVLPNCLAFKCADSPDTAVLSVVPHDDGLPHYGQQQLGEHLADACSHLANLPDNARKLSAPGSAFVIHSHIVKTNLAVQHILHGGTAPKPTLPDGCSYLLVGGSLLPDPFVMYSADSGWQPHSCLFRPISLWETERAIRARWAERGRR